MKLVLPVEILRLLTAVGNNQVPSLMAHDVSILHPLHNHNHLNLKNEDFQALEGDELEESVFYDGRLELQMYEDEEYEVHTVRPY
ncbi:hypothetical protein Tco_0027020 [Tanacetum coccineum]